MNAPSRTKAVIVTGGSAGIGKATVEHLVELGYDVGFNYRSRATEAEELCARLGQSGRRVVAVHADLVDPNAAIEAVDALVEQLGGSLYGLVNNAGINRRALLEEEDVAGFQDVINVNLASPLFAAQAALRHMASAEDGGGRIVNVTSILDRVPLHGASVYCASKAALAMVTEVLALELSRRGVTVNTVAPGHVATPMNFGGQEVDAHTVTRSAIPVGRPAAPREIAAAVAYFLSEDAAYATGANLLVDGGLVLQSGPESLETSPEFLDNADKVAEGA